MAISGAPPTASSPLAGRRRSRLSVAVGAATNSRTFLQLANRFSLLGTCVERGVNAVPPKSGRAAATVVWVGASSDNGLHRGGTDGGTDTEGVNLAPDASTNAPTHQRFRL